MKLESDVERGLSAQRRQHRVRLLNGEDLLDDLGGDRLDIGPIGHVRIGHDRGRVRVDEHHHEALLAEGLARLSSRIVELARLPDHDRASTDNQNLMDVGTFGQSGRAFSQ